MKRPGSAGNGPRGPGDGIAIHIIYIICIIRS